MTNTEKFFVECVKKGIKNEKIDFVPDELDYKRLFELCTAHSMSVVVYKSLEKVKEQLFSRFLLAIEKAVQHEVRLDVQSEYDINTVLTAFEKNRIKHMPLKGYHLKKIYPSSDMRFATDCDILIDVNQIKEVRKLVKELGLETKRHDEHHDIVFYPNTRTFFELHKSIFVGPLEKYFGVGNKGFEKAKVKDGYNYFYQMDKEIFYISILGHSAYHFAESAGVGIRHLTDIYLYRKAFELNENYLNFELEKCGLLQFKNEFEKVAFYLFEDEKADEFTIKLAKHIIESDILSNSDKKSASDVASNTNGGNENAYKKTFWRKIFLPTEQMKFAFPILKKAIWLLPFCHVYRWIKVIFTRPKSISKLKKMNQVSEGELNYMKEIRDGLNINHL